VTKFQRRDGEIALVQQFRVGSGGEQRSDDCEISLRTCNFKKENDSGEEHPRAEKNTRRRGNQKVERGTTNHAEGSTTNPSRQR